MKNIIKGLILSITLLGFVSCSTSQREELKTVTAQGLSEGITKVLLTEALECQNEDAVRMYVEDKVCTALKANCGYTQQYISNTKGVVSRYACKMAVKIAMPAVLPSRQLPIELKAAGCQASGLDTIAQDFADKLCDKL